LHVLIHGDNGRKSSIDLCLVTLEGRNISGLSLCLKSSTKRIGIGLQGLQETQDKAIKARGSKEALLKFGSEHLTNCKFEFMQNTLEAKALSPVVILGASDATAATTLVLSEAEKLLAAVASVVAWLMAVSRVVSSVAMTKASVNPPA
jgi:hypothetical protein